MRNSLAVLTYLPLWKSESLFGAIGSRVNMRLDPATIRVMVGIDSNWNVVY